MRRIFGNTKKLFAASCFLLLLGASVSFGFEDANGFLAFQPVAEEELSELRGGNREDLLSGVVKEARIILWDESRAKSQTSLSVSEGSNVSVSALTAVCR